MIVIVISGSGLLTGVHYSHYVNSSLSCWDHTPGASCVICQFIRKNYQHFQETYYPFVSQFSRCIEKNSLENIQINLFSLLRKTIRKSGHLESIPMTRNAQLIASPASPYCCCAEQCRLSRVKYCRALYSVFDNGNTLLHKLSSPSVALIKMD